MIKHIQIGGAKRPIRFSINALMEFEEITGIDITETEGRAQMMKLKNIRALAFSGLKHGFKVENPAQAIPFTVEEVGDWLDTANQDLILNVFSNETSIEGDQEEVDDKKKLAGEASGQ